MNGMSRPGSGKRTLLLPSRPEMCAAAEVRSQPGGKCGLIGVFPYEPQHPCTNATPWKGPDPNIVGNLGHDPPPLPSTPQIGDIRPHLKVHQVIAALSREQNPTVGGNVSVGIRDYGTERAVDRLRPVNRRIV